MTYDEHRAALIQYLKAKVDICDWHAVRDACVDIEILEARREEANFLLPQVSEVEQIRNP